MYILVCGVQWKEYVYFGVQCAVCSVQCAMEIICIFWCSVFCVLCSVSGADQCSVFSVQCSVFSVQSHQPPLTSLTALSHLCLAGLAFTTTWPLIGGKLKVHKDKVQVEKDEGDRRKV